MVRAPSLIHQLTVLYIQHSELDPQHYVRLNSSTLPILSMINHSNIYIKTNTHVVRGHRLQNELSAPIQHCCGSPIRRSMSWYLYPLAIQSAGKRPTTIPYRFLNKKRRADGRNSWKSREGNALWLGDYERGPCDVSLSRSMFCYPPSALSIGPPPLFFQHQNKRHYPLRAVVPSIRCLLVHRRGIGCLKQRSERK